MRAYWDKSFSPSRPVLEGKIQMKWNQPYSDMFFGWYVKTAEVRLCIGYQKPTNFEK